jgi:phage terminase Nu1 subunit (DNA packaging protein)
MNKKANHVPLSTSAYARHRGVSRQAVITSIQRGRLKDSVVQTDNGPKIVDVELADREWESGRKLPSNGDDGPTSLTEASAIEKRWKGKIAELEYRKRAGELAELGDLEARLVNVFAAVRTRLLGVAARARQRIPDLTAADVQVIDEIVREALEELSRWKEPQEEDGEGKEA